MTIPWQSIQGFAGATGVGALCLLGVFLIVDGLAPNTFPTVETFAKTATWGVVMAVPSLAVAYVVGLLAIGAVQGLTSGLMPGSVGSVGELLVVSGGPNPVLARYQQLRQEQEILAGSTLAFIILAAGAFLETRNLPGWRRSLLFVGLGALLVAGASLALSSAKGHAAQRLVKELPSPGAGEA